ncbi:MAG: hypothetical protein ACI8P0_004497 [Planctomycetaceae bacterium]|jgi:hypothetical protein
MTRKVFLLIAVVSYTSAPAIAFDDGDENALRHILAVEKDRFVERNAELAPVRNRGLDSAWWQSGFVAGDDRWLTYDEAVATTKRSEMHRLYEVERAATVDSPEDHIRLASWCRRNGLLDQERAHLIEALMAKPELQTERLLKRAGFERALGGWMSKEQRNRLEDEVARIDDSLNHWRQKLVRINRQLAGSMGSQRKALSELKEIIDPRAVGAVDLVLGRSPRLSTARAAMQTLGQIDSYEASQVLAKFAVFSDIPTIRREATQQLSGRRYEDFVPGMISLMATETQATFTPYRIAPSMYHREIVVDLKLQRETDDQIQVSHGRLRLISEITRVLRFTGQRKLVPHNPASFSAFTFDTQIHSAKRRIDELNEVTAEINNRIVPVLASLSGRNTNPNPNYWWNWWNEERDVDAAPREVVEVNEEDTIIRDTYTLHRVSCFAAGTPAWTETGLKPIESIRIGERVLSKNVETGELAFRTVLKTTVRKAKPLVVIRSDGEEIKATGGHQFWQSGQGWVKARDLEAFGRLHTVTGNVFVNDVQPGPTEQTYNLVVEDSHTYFVGKAGLLVQDLLLTAPTNMVVPGLTRFEMQNLAKAE